jgi:hypothetical protein
MKNPPWLYDEIAALAFFLLHLGILPLLIESGKNESLLS